MKWTIAAIKKANAEAGGVFFDRSHTKRSETLPQVYQCNGGEVAFVTKDTEDGVTSYAVWDFNPDTAAIRLVDRCEDRSEALRRAAAWVATE